VGEWLWFTLATHRLSGSDYHHYIVTYATDRKDTAREGRGVGHECVRHEALVFRMEVRPSISLPS
jgi:hypothetical protein